MLELPFHLFLYLKYFSCLSLYDALLFCLSLFLFLFLYLFYLSFVCDPFLSVFVCDHLFCLSLCVILFLSFFVCDPFFLSVFVCVILFSICLLCDPFLFFYLSLCVWSLFYLSFCGILFLSVFASSTSASWNVSHAKAVRYLSTFVLSNMHVVFSSFLSWFRPQISTGPTCRMGYP